MRTEPVFSQAYRRQSRVYAADYGTNLVVPFILHLGRKRRRKIARATRCTQLPTATRQCTLNVRVAICFFEDTPFGTQPGPRLLARGLSVTYTRSF